MTDEELVRAFESGALAAAAFHHTEHVRLTWLYLRHYGREEAERLMLTGLEAFAARAGKPEKFDAALTRAWLAAIDDARLAAPSASFDELVTARPQLLDRRSVEAGLERRGL